MDASAQPPIDVAQLEKPGPKTFGKFKIVGRLGRGGMGIVLDALTPEGEPVALKLIRPTGDPDKRKVFSARLYREAKILTKLSHPGVVRLVDSGCIHGILYLAMGRVEGKSLGTMLKRGPLDAEVVLSLGIRIADTLAHLHEIGVVHRDIKPDNVIIDTTGRPILTDFGLARLSGATAITRRDELVGSLGYIAPEIVEGDDPTPKSDQYALGRLLFTLGAGEPPPLHERVPLLEQLAQSLRIDWSRFPGDGLFGAMRPIIRHMIRTDPANRFPDMYTCIVELERLLPKEDPSESESTDRHTVTRPKGQDWSSQPDSQPPAKKRDKDWEDDTRYVPDATGMSGEVLGDVHSKAPWLATDLRAPAALPDVDLALADPNSESGPPVAESPSELPAPQPEIMPTDDLANAADTRDLILKMRRRTQMHWAELEGKSLIDEADPVGSLRKRTQAFLKAKHVEPTDASSAPETPSVEILAVDPAEAIAEWSHIVDDLVPPSSAPARSSAGEVDRSEKTLSDRPPQPAPIAQLPLAQAMPERTPSVIPQVPHLGFQRGSQATLPPSSPGMATIPPENATLPPAGRQKTKHQSPILFLVLGILIGAALASGVFYALVLMH